MGIQQLSRTMSGAYYNFRTTQLADNRSAASGVPIRRVVMHFDFNSLIFPILKSMMRRMDPKRLFGDRDMICNIFANALQSAITHSSAILQHQTQAPLKIEQLRFCCDGPRTPHQKDGVRLRRRERSAPEDEELRNFIRADALYVCMMSVQFVDIKHWKMVQDGVEGEVEMFRQLDPDVLNIFHSNDSDSIILFDLANIEGALFLWKSFGYEVDYYAGDNVHIFFQNPVWKGEPRGYGWLYAVMMGSDYTPSLYTGKDCRTVVEAMKEGRVPIRNVLHNPSQLQYEIVGGIRALLQNHPRRKQPPPFMRQMMLKDRFRPVHNIGSYKILVSFLVFGINIAVSHVIDLCFLFHYWCGDDTFNNLDRQSPRLNGYYLPQYEMNGVFDCLQGLLRINMPNLMKGEGKEKKIEWSQESQIEIALALFNHLHPLTHIDDRDLTSIEVQKEVMEFCKQDQSFITLCEGSAATWQGSLLTVTHV